LFNRRLSGGSLCLFRDRNLIPRFNSAVEKLLRTINFPRMNPKIKLKRVACPTSIEIAMTVRIPSKGKIEVIA
jgi:hypothetical protein